MSQDELLEMNQKVAESAFLLEECWRNRSGFGERNSCSW